MASQAQMERAVRKILLNWGVNAPVRAVADAIRKNDQDRLLRLLGISVDKLSPLLMEVQGSFVSSGSMVIQRAPSALVGAAGFGMANPVVSAYIQTKSFDLVQRITSEQKRILADVLSEVAVGRRNPLTAVKQIIGVKGPTGKRLGAINGLSWNQYQYVERMREELADPAKMARYFQRKRRSKLFDRTVQAAIDKGLSLPPATIDKMAASYTQNLLKLRAEAIARTEYKEAVEAGRQAGIRSMVDSGAVAEQDVVRYWDSTGDRKTRPSHRHMDNGKGVGLNEPFVTANGHQMLYPGDTSLGAPAEEVVNCRCILRIEIDFFAALRRQEKGELV